jgi:hypothetical protein
VQFSAEPYRTVVERLRRHHRIETAGIMYHSVAGSQIGATVLPASTFE